MKTNEPLTVIASRPDTGRCADIIDVINEIDGHVVSQNYNEVCTVGFDDLRRWLIVLQREHARLQLVVPEQRKLDEVLSDMLASFWLKDALKTALTRDPVDAARDAEILAHVLINRANEILNADTQPSSTI